MRRCFCCCCCGNFSILTANFTVFTIFTMLSMLCSMLSHVSPSWTIGHFYTTFESHWSLPRLTQGPSHQWSSPGPMSTFTKARMLFALPPNCCNTTSAALLIVILQLSLGCVLVRIGGIRKHVFTLLVFEVDCLSLLRSARSFRADAQVSTICILGGAQRPPPPCWRLRYITIRYTYLRVLLGHPSPCLDFPNFSLHIIKHIIFSSSLEIIYT